GLERGPRGRARVPGRARPGPAEAGAHPQGLDRLHARDRRGRGQHVRAAPRARVAGHQGPGCGPRGLSELKTRTPEAEGLGRSITSGELYLSDGDVGRARPLRAVDDLELHLVALVEGAETLGADLRVVDENVRTTLAREEAEALGFVEPL